jgi:hypothetical protein
MLSHQKEPITYNIYDKENKTIGYVCCRYDKITFLREGFNDGLDILTYNKEGLSFWSDFAEKDESAKRISGESFGIFTSPEKFISDMKEHMPYHFEWCVWNLL